MKRKPIVFDSLLVLFGGAGLATHGLVKSGCAKRIVSVELDPAKHHLSKILNPSVEHIEADVMALDDDWLASFDAVWASPPCQERSNANGKLNGARRQRLDTLLQWSLSLTNKVLWVENVIDKATGDNAWGVKYNAVQFQQKPRQMRQRIIGGRHRKPKLFYPFEESYRSYGMDVCNAILASEYKTPGSSAGANYYGRRISVREAAYHQGLDRIPDGIVHNWWYPMQGYTWTQWRKNLYEGIGNGVPVYMAQAFGEAYSKPNQQKGYLQLNMFDYLEQTA